MIEAKKATSRQFSTFYIGNRLYGIDVIQVQEVAKPLPITPIHRAPPFVAGLINLRGQIATAIWLGELFGIEKQAATEHMSVVCKCEGTLLSLLVDQIGDVIEVSETEFEPPPETMPEGVRRFMNGVYKTPNTILTVIEVNKINNHLTKN